MQMNLRSILLPVCAFAAIVSAVGAERLFCSAASALTLDDFSPVHKAKVEKKGTNDVVLLLNSGEWSSGLAWQSPAGADFSQAKYLAVDVENLSKTRQGRLTLHLSAGGASGDSGDHATAIFKKNRSVNTGIGLNPGEKGTMRLLLTHPEIYAAPEGARGPYVVDTHRVTSVSFQLQWPYEDEIEDLPDFRLSNLRLEGEPDRERAVPAETYVPFVDKYGQFAHADWKFKIHSDKELKADLKAELAHPLIVGCHWFQYRDQPLLGRGDGEAYQIGFVDVCDRPYPELTRAARKLGAELYEKRAKGVW